MWPIRSLPRLACVCGVVAALSAGAFAGPIDPPGDVKPTLKPLAEVEPRVAISVENTPGDADSTFRISQPGSYYLTANITATSGRDGIEVAASNVTIDLNGFTIDGRSLSPVGISDVGDEGTDIAGLTVRNGNLRGFTSAGVRFGRGADNVSPRLERLTATANNVGFEIEDDAVFIACIAAENTLAGFLDGSFGSQYTDCRASFNGGRGFDGLFFATLTNCVASFNQSSGFSGSGSSFFNCVAHNTDGNGFDAVSSTFTACWARNNLSRGFSVGSNSFVRECVAQSNVLDGFALGSDSTIVGSRALANGAGASNVGAGISVTGTSCVVDSNHANNNDTGISVSSIGATVTRNTCSGNTTNYSISANSRYGEIVNATATGAAAATGNSATSTLLTTDPWANLAY